MKDNPVRYNDPSGHKACGDGEESSCSGKKQDPNEDPYADDNVDTPDPDPNSELEKNPVDIDFCAQNPYAPECASLLPPHVCNVYPVITAPGTAYDYPGCQYHGLETFTNWDKVDWLGVFSNSLGIIGGAVLLFSIIGGPTIIPGAVFYEATQIVGMIIDIYREDKEGITWDAISTIASENKFLGRLVPGLGVAFNFGNLSDIAAAASDVRPVYTPYPQPMVLPSYP